MAQRGGFRRQARLTDKAMPGFFTRKLAAFQTWWKTPATTRDRTAGVMVGGLGGFWIGLIGRIVIGALPVDLLVAVAWGIGTAVLLAAVGYRYPKPAICFLFPFATFGISPS